MTKPDPALSIYETSKTKWYRKVEYKKMAQRSDANKKKSGTMISSEKSEFRAGRCETNNAALWCYVYKAQWRYQHSESLHQVAEHQLS